MMTRWFSYLANARYMSLLPYAGYLFEVKEAVSQNYDNELLAERLTHILHRIADQYTGGEASRRLNRAEVVQWVGQGVGMFSRAFGDRGGPLKRRV